MFIPLNLNKIRREDQVFPTALTKTSPPLSWQDLWQHGLRGPATEIPRGVLDIAHGHTSYACLYLSLGSFPNRARRNPSLNLSEFPFLPDYIDEHLENCTCCSVQVAQDVDYFINAIQNS